MTDWKHEQLNCRWHRVWLGVGVLLFAIQMGTPGHAQAQNSPASTDNASQSAASPSTPPAENSAAKPSQQPDASSTNRSGAYTITTVVNEVNLLFTVTDKHGHFIRNLTASDFSLLDDHMAPVAVYSFTQETNLPLRVGLMIDTSSSIRSRFQFEQNAATEFLLSIVRPRVDKAFVMGFDTTPSVTQKYTNDGDLLSTGIRKLAPGGGTALYDATYTACRDQMLPLATTGSFRKTLIVLSDGDDDQSHATLDDAVKMCQRAETTIYTISTNDSPSRDRGDDILKAMAVATGGRAFTPFRMEDVANAFQNIQEELRSQYSLVYKPANFKANGAFRPIYLTCFDHNYKVRAMKGYFAPKAPN